MKPVSLIITALAVIALLILFVAWAVSWIYNLTDLDLFFGTGPMSALQGPGVVLLAALIGFGGSAGGNGERAS